jgi:hypothetical protein
MFLNLSSQVVICIVKGGHFKIEKVLCAPNSHKICDNGCLIYKLETYAEQLIGTYQAGFRK